MANYGLDTLFSNTRRPESLYNPFAESTATNPTFLSDLVGDSGFGANEKSAKDIAGHLLRYGDIVSGQRGPLEGQGLGLLSDILNGGGEFFNRYMGPMTSAITGQIPQAQRQARDTTSGGALMQALTSIPEKALGAISSGASGVMNSLGPMALNTATSLPSIIGQLFGLAGQIGKDPPKQQGGGS